VHCKHVAEDLFFLLSMQVTETVRSPQNSTNYHFLKIGSMASKIVSDFCKLLTFGTNHLAKPQYSSCLLLSLCAIVRLDKGGQGLQSFIIFRFLLKFSLKMVFLINLE
jgi:hypothetical protein